MSKPLQKFSYAEIARLTRADLGTQSEPKLGTQSTQSTLGTQQPEPQPVLKMPEGVAKAPWKDEREQLNLKLAQPLLERLRRYAFENRLTVTGAVIQALEMLLGTQSTQGRLGTQGRNLPSIDDDFDDDDPRARESRAQDHSIISLCEKAIGNTFNERDREVLNEYQHFGENCLTLAILTGRNRSKKRINSLRFFEGNIREVAAWQPDKIKRELEFQWAQFRRRVRS
jgi:hypothetical protein